MKSLSSMTKNTSINISQSSSTVVKGSSQGFWAERIWNCGRSGSGLLPVGGGVSPQPHPVKAPVHITRSSTPRLSFFMILIPNVGERSTARGT